MPEKSEGKYEFKAEIKKLLNILSKSLYKHKEIFLRELISNSVDALGRMRYLALVEKDVESPDAPLEIQVIIDEDARTLTVSDTGIGMTKDELVNNLGTIAGSGSQKFLEQLSSKKEGDKEFDLDVIGQFGVGFYSVFMVADRVRVVSKSYRKGEPAYEWSSDGTGEFSVAPAEKDGRGTDVVLYLREGEDDFLKTYRVKDTIRKYSNFVPYPIYVDTAKELAEREEKTKRVVDAEYTPEEEEGGGEAGEEEEKKEDKGKVGEKEEEEKEEEELPERTPVNETEPLWTRPASKISDEDYRAFYHNVARRYDDYLHVVNYKVDGRVQFRSIVFIPERKSAELLQPELEYGLALYSKNVLVIDHYEDIIPKWLRFVKGVLESDDIPLNVSRETIQANRMITKMSNLVVKRLLKELSDMAEKEPDKYKKFWEEFGFFIKEGIVTDQRRRDKLLPLLRFKTSTTPDDEWAGLEQYVATMKPGQEDIYYLVGEDLKSMKLSPHLGYYKKEGLSVILFDEPIDNFLMMHLHEYTTKVGEGDDAEEKTFHFKPIDVTEEEEKGKKAGDEAEGEGPEGKGTDEAPEVTEDQKKFLERVKSILGDKIVDAKMSDRLYDSPCRLANPATGMSSSMQRAMRFWTQTTTGKDFQVPRKVLEFNPEHPTVSGLVEICANDPENGKVEPVVTQLFENCLLAEGDLPNPASMVPRLNQLLEMVVTGRDDVKIVAYEEGGTTTTTDAGPGGGEEGTAGDGEPPGAEEKR
ncbi:MAG: molecular chaperone HtpG [Promethearchaeota archaeon]